QDGAHFISEALARGAVALAGPPETRLPETAASVPFLAVAEVRRAKAIAAHAFHGDPSASLTCIGITGTKGKTTTAMLVHSVLAAAELKPTLLGTIEERVFGQPSRPAEQTTPDSLRLAELLAMTRDAGG